MQVFRNENFGPIISIIKFISDKEVIDLFIDIISSSDALSEYLSNNVQVLDAVIGGAFWHEWPGLAQSTVSLYATGILKLKHLPRLRPGPKRASTWF